MSTNATFARSRPRVRHQRQPKTQSCDHPRFMQLVKELARINEAKKKQEETEGGISGSDCCDEDSGGSSGLGCNFVQQASTNLVSTSRINCCSSIVPQTSSSFRTLDTNQANSALHNNNYRQHHQLYCHNHQQQIQPHQQQLNYNDQHQYDNISHINYNSTNNNNINNYHHHDQQQLSNTTSLEDRCASKCLPSSFGYSKQGLVEQNNSEILNNDLDLRQDENRSKRKRSANESSSNSRKNSLSSCGGSGTSKKLKSSSDSVRPLSPSFTKCPICLLDCMDRDPSFTNTCFHLFCYVCIENWTKSKATCPLCRSKFTKIIYNIKSATNYEEKIASPLRRDDDDGYLADRLMLEQLSGLNANSSIPNRNSHSEEVQFLFENFRQPIPQYFVNQTIPPLQGEPPHSFNSVTSSMSFNSNVPHTPFTPTSYPIASNFIALYPNRIAPATSTAITSAYTTNSSSNRVMSPRMSRINRYISNRRMDRSTIDGTSRVSRASIVNISQTGVPLERHHHHHHHQQHQHQNFHQYHQQTQHQPTTVFISRQNQRSEPSHPQIQLPPIQQRPIYPDLHPRRGPYNSPTVEAHHLIDLYRQLPDTGF